MFIDQPFPVPFLKKDRTEILDEEDVETAVNIYPIFKLYLENPWAGTGSEYQSTCIWAILWVRFFRILGKAKKGGHFFICVKKA